MINKKENNLGILPVKAPLWGWEVGKGQTEEILWAVTKAEEADPSRN